MAPQLSRLFMIFGVLILAFGIIFGVARPRSFYQYGHYRGKALDEAVKKTPRYIVRTQCAECHEEESGQNASGPHRSLSCQICHGPGGDHVDDPSPNNIVRPQVRETCLRCHDQRQARPAWFPQINDDEHSSGELCSTCHIIHNPAEMK